MAEIEADYLGGDPAGVEAQGTSGRLAAEAGSLTYTGQRVDGAITRTPVTLALPKEEIRAISVDTPANLSRVLTRAVVGELVGGALGATVGAVTGRRDRVLLVAVSRGGHDFLLSFGVTGQDGIWLLDAIQAGRLRRGEDPLPRVEGPAAAAPAAVDRQTEVLEEIRDLLARQVELLDRLTERLPPAP